MNYELFQLINNLAGTYTWLDISMILTVKYLAGCFCCITSSIIGTWNLLQGQNTFKNKHTYHSVSRYHINYS